MWLCRYARIFPRVVGDALVIGYTDDANVSEKLVVTLWPDRLSAQSIAGATPLECLNDKRLAPLLSDHPHSLNLTDWDGLLHDVAHKKPHHRLSRFANEAHTFICNHFMAEPKTRLGHGMSPAEADDLIAWAVAVLSSPVAETGEISLGFSTQEANQSIVSETRAPADWPRNASILLKALADQIGDLLAPAGEFLVGDNGLYHPYAPLSPNYTFQLPFTAHEQARLRRLFTKPPPHIAELKNTLERLRCHLVPHIDFGSPS